jgi:hypothetical protein
MIEEAEEILVRSSTKIETLWKFAKKGTIFKTRIPTAGQDNVHIFKDLTQVYRDNPARKNIRKWACIFWLEGERAQQKLTPKEVITLVSLFTTINWSFKPQEAALVRKYYNDRGRESIDWAEAEAYQNKLRDAETGATYLYLPHSLWKKHVTSSRQKGEKRVFELEPLEDMSAKAAAAGSVSAGGAKTTKRFSTEYDSKVMNAWAKHSSKCGGLLADPEIRGRLLRGARALAAEKKGYSNGDKHFEALLPIPHPKKKQKKTQS